MTNSPSGENENWMRNKELGALHVNGFIVFFMNISIYLLLLVACNEDLGGL